MKHWIKTIFSNISQRLARRACAKVCDLAKCTRFSCCKR